MQKVLAQSVGPEDYIDFYSDLFNLVELRQETWIGPKSKEVVPEVVRRTRTLPPADLALDEDTDWVKYGPPASLRKAPGITSTIILDIITTSIENLKAQVAERQKQREEEEKRRAIEKEVTVADGKPKEPYLPIIIVEDRVDVALESSGKGKEIETEPISSPSPNGLVVLPIKPHKRRRFALKRLFEKIERGGEGGESSAAGAARGLLRNYRQYRSKSSIGLNDEPTKEKASVFKVFAIQKANEEPVECVSCLDEFLPKEMVKAPCHSYCQDCFVRLITTVCNTESQWPPKCCLNEIPARTIIMAVDGDLRKTYLQRSTEWGIPIADRIYCNQPECSLWLKPDQINQALRIARCTEGHWTCTLCRGPQHEGGDCPQDMDMNLTNELAEQEGWKRCYSCHALVEHREACQHMTCRCGSQFCYVCGARWRTCACTMEQLASVKAGAATRRQQRLEREAEAEAELREMLRQIEEFEREEALKQVLLREEQERLEAERRQRELEERVRQESIRRREVELKYEELRDILDGLHEVQRVLVEYEQEKSEETLKEEAIKTKEALETKQETEKEEMKVALEASIAKREQEFQKELAARVSGEKKLEEDYHQKLEDFYAGKDGSDALVEAAMKQFCKKMDKGFRSWGRYRDAELADFRAKLEEEHTIKEELMYSVKHRLNDAYEEREEDMQRRRVAELKWVQLVILERERLLAEMETEELDGDAASWFSMSGDEEEDDHEHEHEHEHEISAAR